MVGKAGHSGRKPLPIVDHLLKGMFRPSRHGAALSYVTTDALDPVVSSRQVRRVASGLGPAGRRFVRALLSEYRGWDVAGLLALHRAGRTVDRISALDEAIDADGPVATGKRGARHAHPLLATQRSEIRQLLALIRHLDLETER